MDNMNLAMLGCTMLSLLMGYILGYASGERDEIIRQRQLQRIKNERGDV